MRKPRKKFVKSITRIIIFKSATVSLSLSCLFLSFLSLLMRIPYMSHYKTLKTICTMQYRAVVFSIGNLRETYLIKHLSPLNCGTQCRQLYTIDGCTLPWMFTTTFIIALGFISAGRIISSKLCRSCIHPAPLIGSKVTSMFGNTVSRMKRKILPSLRLVVTSRRERWVSFLHYVSSRAWIFSASIFMRVQARFTLRRLSGVSRERESFHQSV